MNPIVQKTWTTQPGYRAKVVLVNGSHHCGYVQLSPTHPLFQVPYDKSTPLLAAYCKHINLLEQPIGKRGIISVLLHDTDEPRPDAIFNVHGSLTYSGYIDEPNTFWYGYDCNHDTDLNLLRDPRRAGAEFRTFSYCESECESLAKQLHDFELWASSSSNRLPTSS